MFELYRALNMKNASEWNVNIPEYVWIYDNSQGSE